MSDYNFSLKYSNEGHYNQGVELNLNRKPVKIGVFCQTYNFVSEKLNQTSKNKFG